MDDARRTMHDDGRQPIIIGHLNDSVDLTRFLENWEFESDWYKDTRNEWHVCVVEFPITRTDSVSFGSKYISGFFSKHTEIVQDPYSS